MNESIGGYILWLVTAIYSFLETAFGWFLLSLLAVLGFGCQQPTALMTTAETAEGPTAQVVPVDQYLRRVGLPAEMGQAFDVELYLSSGQDQGIFGVQSCLAWNPELFIITGAITYAPHIPGWGAFPGIYGGANDDLSDGEAVYVYLCDFPPAIPPRSNVHLATIHCRALGSGTAHLDLVHQVPSSTLWSRVANDQAQDATGSLAGCAIEIVALLGDVNGDGQVDNADLIAVRVNRGKPVTDANRTYDVNRDGVIDNADMIAVRVRRENSP